MTGKLKMEQTPLADAVAKIKDICPSAVTNDGKVDIEQLKTFFGTDVAEDNFEKYEFTWVGKNTAKAEANRPIRKTLRPIVEDSKNWDTTQNLYIEGGNLDALKLLQESYLGKVKMIYIDPPYNTGNDFIYCDEFSVGCEEYLDKKGQCDADGNRLFVNTETNGRFHSDWCSMMYPRLKLARDLLTNDGLIFISIDDHEVTNLKKICDEIFGESNFISDFVRKTKSQTNDAKTGVNYQHEFVLVYARNKESIVLHGEDKDFSNYKNPDNDPNGAWIVDNPSARSGGPNSAFPIENPYTGTIDYPPQGRYWAFAKKTFEEWCKTGKVQFKKTVKKGERGFIVKKYLSDLKSDKKLIDSLCFIGNEYMNQVATKELNDIFEKGDFTYPKPVSFIKKLISCVQGNDFIVLDFFSGSGTTAHAVMQLNTEDGGHRKFIMVQMQEPCPEGSEYSNICEIGKERIRRAGNKIVDETGKNDLDIGFRAFRVDSTNMEDVFYKPADIKQSNLLEAVDNIKKDRSDLDLLFGVMVDCGLPLLDRPIETKILDGKKYYVVDGNYLVACFEPKITEKLVYEIANMKPMCAVFRDSSFGEAKDKINVSEIFKNITGSDECVKVL